MTSGKGPAASDFGLLLIVLCSENVRLDAAGVVRLGDIHITSTFCSSTQYRKQERDVLRLRSVTALLYSEARSWAVTRYCLVSVYGLCYMSVNPEMIQCA